MNTVTDTWPIDPKAPRVPYSTVGLKQKPMTKEDIDKWIDLFKKSERMRFRPGFENIDSAKIIGAGS